MIITTQQYDLFNNIHARKTFRHSHEEWAEIRKQAIQDRTECDYCDKEISSKRASKFLAFDPLDDVGTETTLCKSCNDSKEENPHYYERYHTCGVCLRLIDGEKNLTYWDSDLICSRCLQEHRLQNGYSDTELDRFAENDVDYPDPLQISEMLIRANGWTLFEQFDYQPGITDMQAELRKMVAQHRSALSGHKVLLVTDRYPKDFVSIWIKE